ncbi:MAG: DUF1223 domain-containing protein [Amaricoccus sp.]
MQLLPALAVMAMVAPISATAQDNPVVLELFTSQGCISCPPADALLAELAQDKGVLPLALHVTYWDYLGWRDSFGQEAFTQRQKAYARTMRRRTLYTPQMIVEGEDMLVGHDQAAIDRRIAEHRSQPSPVDLSASRSDGRLHLKLGPRGEAVGPADIELVQFEPASAVEIETGENAGQTITYTNVVTDWQTVGRWDGVTEVDLDFDGVGAGPMAVIVQSAGLGPILTAAKLD